MKTIKYALSILSLSLLHSTANALLITADNTVIDGKRISSTTGHCVEVSGASNVIIRNSIIGPCKGNGVFIHDSQGVEVRNNNIEKVQSGVYAVNSSKINVHHNRMLNMQGPMPRGQFVQFNNVSGNGNRINYNEGENVSGLSTPEDLINLYKTRGTSADPVQIIGNKFKGGGPSTSGGGIMTGDNDGAFTLVKDNILVDPGQYGIAIAGGEGIKITGNKVYARQQAFTNVGIYVWRQKNTTRCQQHEVSYNQVRWYNKNGVANSGWNAGNCGTVTGWNTNDWKASINASLYEGLKVATLLNQSAGTQTNSRSPQISGIQIINAATNKALGKRVITKQISCNPLG